MAAFDEAPLPGDPGRAGIVDADPRRGDHHGSWLVIGRPLETERRRRITQVHTGPASVQPERRSDQARPAGQPLAWQARDALRRGDRAVTGHAAPPRGRADDAVDAHRLDALERLDGAHQHGSRRAVRFGHHVEAVVHPVDKVHVGPAGGPEHDPVAGGLAEPRVRGTIVSADVGLDFDDPAGPTPGRVVADEARPDQRASGLGGRTLQECPIDDVQTDGYIASMRSGMNSPVRRKKNGMSVSRKTSTIWDESSAVQMSRRNGSSSASGGMPGILKNESRITITMPRMRAAWTRPRMPPRISSAKRAFWNNGWGLYQPWMTRANATADATKTVPNPTM